MTWCGSKLTQCRPQALRAAAKGMRSQIQAIGEAYKGTGVNVKIGFFDFSPK